MLLVFLSHHRRQGRRQRLEQGRVIDQLGRDHVAGDDDLLADAGHLEQLGRERVGQPDAAM